MVWTRYDHDNPMFHFLANERHQSVNAVADKYNI